MDTDAALLSRWQAGEDAAGSELFKRHFASVYRFFINKLPAHAEDLTQQTFMGVLEGRSRIRGDSTFRTYLFAVARNKLLMHLRSKYRRSGRLDPGSWSMVDARGAPLEHAVRDDRQRLLATALERIPVDYQVTLELHYWQDFSVAEIAGVLDCAPGTIKSRLSRARKLLESALTETELGHELVKSTIDGLDRWLRALPGAYKRASA